MKLVILLAVMLFTLPSFAETVEFKENSVLPVNLQKAIVRQITKDCPKITSQNWSVRETHTEMYTEPIDQGATEFYYNTRFHVEGMDNDNMHPYPFSMTIESMEQLETKQVQVLKIKGCR